MLLRELDQHPPEIALRHGPVFAAVFKFFQVAKVLAGPRYEAHAGSLA